MKALLATQFKIAEAILVGEENVLPVVSPLRSRNNESRSTRSCRIVRDGMSLSQEESSGPFFPQPHVPRSKRIVLTRLPWAYGDSLNNPGGNPGPFLQFSRDVPHTIHTPSHMPRSKRIVVAGMPHHITQRGNGRAKVFDCDQDRRRSTSPPRKLLMSRLTIVGVTSAG
jgi:hypothetical protein